MKNVLALQRISSKVHANGGGNGGGKSSASLTLCPGKSSASLLTCK